MIRFVPMQPELFGLIPIEGELQAGHIVTLPEFQPHICAAPNFALAMIDGGEILGAAGVARVSDWRGYAWLVAGAWMRPRHYALARQRCRAELRRLQAEGLHRIECLTEPGRPAHAHFVVSMGFVWEATMRAFTADRQDEDLWAFVAPAGERRSLAAEGVA